MTTSEGKVEEYMGDNDPGLAEEDIECISNASTSPPTSTVLNTETDESAELSSPLEVSDGEGDDSDGVMPAKYAARKSKVASKKRRKVS